MLADLREQIIQWCKEANNGIDHNEIETIYVKASIAEQMSLYLNIQALVKLNVLNPSNIKYLIEYHVELYSVADFKKQIISWCKEVNTGILSKIETVFNKATKQTKISLYLNIQALVKLNVLNPSNLKLIIECHEELLSWIETGELNAKMLYLLANNEEPLEIIKFFKRFLKVDELNIHNDLYEVENLFEAMEEHGNVALIFPIPKCREELIEDIIFLKDNKCLNSEFLVRLIIAYNENPENPLIPSVIQKLYAFNILDLETLIDAFEKPQWVLDTIPWDLLEEKPYLARHAMDKSVACFIRSLEELGEIIYSDNDESDENAMDESPVEEDNKSTRSKNAKRSISAMLGANEQALSGPEDNEEPPKKYVAGLLNLFTHTPVRKPMASDSSQAKKDDAKPPSCGYW
ncbi:MAG: hypothetical protein LCH30_09145 [Proteobacteria bacterium]|nr:hypothetical protein [Pseudomonadota bacterium]